MAHVQTLGDTIVFSQEIVPIYITQADSEGSVSHSHRVQMFSFCQYITCKLISHFSLNLYFSDDLVWRVFSFDLSHMSSINCLIMSFFCIFLLQLALNIILHEFQVYGTAVRQLYTVVPQVISSTHVAPYIFITLL